jgi:hypothetical protein
LLDELEELLLLELLDDDDELLEEELDDDPPLLLEDDEELDELLDEEELLLEEEELLLEELGGTRGAKVPDPKVNAVIPPLAMKVLMLFVCILPPTDSQATFTVTCIKLGSDEFGVTVISRVALFSPI